MNIFIDYSSTSDSDFDGIVDSDDDYANNPARCRMCCWKIRKTLLPRRLPWNKVTSAGEVSKKTVLLGIPSRLWSDFM